MMKKNRLSLSIIPINQSNQSLLMGRTLVLSVQPRFRDKALFSYYRALKKEMQKIFVWGKMKILEW